MNFHDVVRHLVEHGPWASDADRETALAAVNQHEQQWQLPAPLPAPSFIPVDTTVTSTATVPVTSTMIPTIQGHNVTYGSVATPPADQAPQNPEQQP